ncbi:MAG: 3-phosphoshikimate 1-carboxyvinyltransferase, partial [Clostridiales bacterium]
NIIQEADGYSIPGRQIFRSPGEITVDGDWSNGAFFLVAGALGGGITLRGLDYASPQGDKAIIDLLRRFGADLQIRDAAVRVSPGTLCGCEIDLTDIPDLLPILAVLAAFAQGESRFINGGRLRLKESDRLQTTAAMLKALGGEVIESRSGLIVQGHPLRGGLTESFGDHRIAMAAAVAAASCVEPVLLADAEAVNKSYPGFFDDYQKLGGIAYVI